MEPIQDDKMEEIASVQLAHAIKVPSQSYREVINAGISSTRGDGDTETTLRWLEGAQLMEVQVKQRGISAATIYVPGSNILGISTNGESAERPGLDKAAASDSGGGSPPKAAKRGRPKKTYT